MSSDSSDEIPANTSNKEAIKICNRKIEAIDEESRQLVEEISVLEKRYELLRSRRDLQTKKLQESGLSSSFFGLIILIIISFVIIFK